LLRTLFPGKEPWDEKKASAASCSSNIGLILQFSSRFLHSIIPRLEANREKVAQYQQQDTHDTGMRGKERTIIKVKRENNY
jgi:hypothetical protein